MNDLLIPLGSILGVVGFFTLIAAQEAKAHFWRVALAGALMFILGVACILVDINDYVQETEDAVVTLEERYDITIDERGRVRSNRPSDWMIDGVWRECYLISEDLTKIDTTRLMCDGDDDKFVEVGTVSAIAN